MAEDQSLPPWFDILREDLANQARDHKQDLQDLKKDVSDQVQAMVTKGEFDAEKRHREDAHRRLEKDLEEEVRRRKEGDLNEAKARERALESEALQRQSIADGLAREKQERKNGRTALFGSLGGAVGLIIAALTLYYEVHPH
jgi:hypothetical protein